MDYLALDVALVKIKKKLLLWRLQDGKISQEEFDARGKKLNEEYADARKAIRDAYNRGTDNDDIKKKQEKKLKTLKVLEDELKDLQDSQHKQEVDSEHTGKGR